jgi:hypothetical protein
MGGLEVGVTPLRGVGINHESDMGGLYVGLIALWELEGNNYE